MVSANARHSRMEVLFNSKVISFKSGYEQAGLDFSSANAGVYSVFNTACYPETEVDRRCTFYNTPVSL